MKIFSCREYVIPTPRDIAMSTLVCYHLPSDRDDPDHPNAFTIKKFADEVTLKDVRDNFPIPGEYHFRFKTRFENGGVFWVDTVDESGRVPVFSPNRIVAKVLRLSWNGGAKTQTKSTAVVQPVNATQRVTQVPKMDDLFGSTSPPAQRPTNHVGELDLFG
jgi:hypothetical protein